MVTTRAKWALWENPKRGHLPLLSKAQPISVLLAGNRNCDARLRLLATADDKARVTEAQGRICLRYCSAERCSATVVLASDQNIEGLLSLMVLASCRWIIDSNTGAHFPRVGGTLSSTSTTLCVVLSTHNNKSACLYGGLGYLPFSLKRRV